MRTRNDKNILYWIIFIKMDYSHCFFCKNFSINKNGFVNIENFITDIRKVKYIFLSILNVKLIYDIIKNSWKLWKFVSEVLRGQAAFALNFI